MKYFRTLLTEADDDLDFEEDTDLDLDDDSGDFGTEDFDDFEDDEPVEDDDFSSDDDLPDDDEESSDDDTVRLNEMQRKTIQFPILIEGFGEDDEPISLDFEEEQEFAQEFGDLVIEKLQENKKFIMSALDVYDIEFYYDSYDSNSNVKFIVSSNEEIDSQTLMNVIKRYLNVQVENKVTDEGEFTLSPVLDNKFIRVI